MPINYFCDGRQVKIIATHDLEIGEFIRCDWLTGVSSDYAKKGEEVPIYIQGVFKVPKLGNILMKVGEAVITEIKNNQAYVIHATNAKVKPVISGIVTIESPESDSHVYILLTNAGGQYS